MFWNFNKDWLLDPQNQNSYSYARNNPVTLSDPSGNCPQCIAFAGAVVVGGLVGGTISAVNGGSFWDGAKYGAIAGGTTAIVVMTAGMAAPALGLTSAEAIIGGSAVGNALGGVGARASIGQSTNVDDIGIDLVTGGFGGIIGMGVGGVADEYISGLRMPKAGQVIEGYTVSEHAAKQAALPERQINVGAIKNTLNKPLSTEEIKFDSFGRPSQKIIGEKSTVIINPETKTIPTVTPTKSRIIDRLKK